MKQNSSGLQPVVVMSAQGGEGTPDQSFNVRVSSCNHDLVVSEAVVTARFPKLGQESSVETSAL